MSDEEFLEQLEDLRLLLAQTEVERYNHYLNHSVDGRTCKYAQASLQLFQTHNQRQLLTDKLRVLAALL